MTTNEGPVTLFPCDVAWCPDCGATRDFESVYAAAGSKPVRTCNECKGTRRTGGYYLVPSDWTPPTTTFDIEG